jgi:hypothetical protein
MTALDQASAALAKAEAEYQQVTTRLDSVRAKLDGTPAADTGETSMADQLANLGDALDPAARDKKLRAERDALEGLQADTYQRVMRARQLRDTTAVASLSGPYVAALKALIGAAEAMREAHAQAEVEAAKLAPQLMGATVLPRVRPPHHAALEVIGEAQRAISVCQSATGQDTRPPNRMLDILNPFSRLSLPRAEGLGVERFYKTAR